MGVLRLFGRSGKAATWICPPFVPRAVNAAGETALDVARRLKYRECEELVGGWRNEREAQSGGEGTKCLRRAYMKVGSFWDVSLQSLDPCGLPHPEIPLTCPIPLAAGAGAGREALPANPCGL